MIADALKELFSVAQKAVGASTQAAVLQIPGDPSQVGIVKADGSIVYRDMPAAKRSHRLDSVDEVSGFVKFATETLTASPTVWFSESGLFVVLKDIDAGQRGDTAHIALARTPTLSALIEASTRWVPQKEFVRLLRITLADAATETSALLLRTVRILSFSESTAGHGKVEHGRQSLGRDIEAEVRSEAGEVPEQITLSLRIFTDPALTARFPVRCAVDINPREGTFNLCPMPGELQDAIDGQLEALGERLRNEVECPVFRGRP